MQQLQRPWPQQGMSGRQEQLLCCRVRDLQQQAMQNGIERLSLSLLLLPHLQQLQRLELAGRLDPAMLIREHEYGRG